MKKVLILALVLGLTCLAQAAYTLLVDGQDVEEYTMAVGSSVSIWVCSDDLVPVPTEPSSLSPWLQDGFVITAWDQPEWSTTRGTFTDLVIHNDMAGPDASGWTNAEPYDAIVNLGWVLGSTPEPVCCGVWWEVTFTCLGEGDVLLGLGSYNPDYTVFNMFDSVLIHQIPEPMTLSLLGLGGLLLRRRK